jgi:ubiquinone/menaquinone biosynthesis C-methylase UbiE
MISDSKIHFFDKISKQWDQWHEIEPLLKKIKKGLIDFGLLPYETTIDVGCGTGNLTTALLQLLNKDGHVYAIDISPAMIKKAQAKIKDTRVTWQTTDAQNLNIADKIIDRIICFSVWPHVDNHIETLNEFKRVLKPNSILHIWHLSSKEFVNNIHSNADEAVKNDILLPADQTAQLLEQNGFVIKKIIDDEFQYLVTGQYIK